MSKDTIYRQDAIEAVCTEIMSITDYSLTMAYEIAEEAIECLPSAQPELAQNLHTTCTDAISRQAAIDLLKQMRKDGDMIPWEGKDVFARIRKLPPAQPEGKWIRHCKLGVWECDQCGTQFKFPFKQHYFCPNCGADMREGGRDETD